MPDYTKMVISSRRKLAKLVEQREEIEIRIGQLSQMLRSLVPLLPPDQQDELLDELKAAKKNSGLTKTIMQLLTENPEAKFTSHDIRKHLEKMGFNLLEYSQPLATIANTLARMKAKGRVKCDIVKDNGLTFMWSAALSSKEKALRK